MNVNVGVALVSISAIAFAFLPIFTRVAYEAGADPLGVLVIRFAAASAIMALLVLPRRLPLPGRRTLVFLFLMGGVGYVGQSFLYFTALTMAPVAQITLLLYLYPAIVTILAVVLWKERVTPPGIIALVAALAGMVLVVGIEGGGHPLGALAGLGAAATYSGYIMVGSRVVPRGGALQASWMIMSSAALVFAVISLVQGVNLPTTAAGWGAVSGIAAISTVLAIVTFLAGLERIGPTRSATVSALEPVVTVALAALLLGETLTPARLSGGALILLAVVVLSRKAPAAGKKTVPRKKEEIS